MAYGRKEVPKGQFNDRLGAGSGRIDDADTTGASCHQVDVVNADAGTTDHLETVPGSVDDLGRKFGCTANDDGIKFSQCATEKFSLLDVVHNDIVTRLFKTLNGLLVHPIGHGDSCHGPWLARRC